MNFILTIHHRYVVHFGHKPVTLLTGYITLIILTIQIHSNLLRLPSHRLFLLAGQSRSANNLHPVLMFVNCHRHIKHLSFFHVRLRVNRLPIFSFVCEFNCILSVQWLSFTNSKLGTVEKVLIKLVYQFVAALCFGGRVACQQ